MLFKLGLFFLYIAYHVQLIHCAYTASVSNSNQSPLTKRAVYEYTYFNVPWAFPPQDNLSPHFYNQTNQFSPMSLFFSLFHLQNFAPTKLASAIDAFFPNVSKTHFSFRSPQKFLNASLFGYWYHSGDESEVNTDLPWGVRLDTPEDFFLPENKTVFCSVFFLELIPKFPTVERHYFHSVLKDWQSYWTHFHELNLTIHKTGNHRSIAIPMEDNYVIHFFIPNLQHNPQPSQMHWSEVFQLLSFGKKEIQPIRSFAIPKLHSIRTMHTNLTSFFNLTSRPVFYEFNTSNSQFPIIETMHHMSSIQFSTNGVMILGYTQFDGFDVFMHPPMTLPPMPQYTYQDVEVQVDTPFFVIVVHKSTRACAFMGYFNNHAKA